MKACIHYSNSQLRSGEASQNVLPPLNNSVTQPTTDLNQCAPTFLGLCPEQSSTWSHHHGNINVPNEQSTFEHSCMASLYSLFLVLRFSTHEVDDS